MKRMLIAAALLATVVAAPASAIPAGPAAGLDSAAAAIDNVEKVWGGHRSCEWGPVRGWHRHAGWGALAVPCAPQAAQPFHYWGVRRCRW